MTLSDWKPLEGGVSERDFQKRVEKGGFFGLFLADALIGSMNLNLFGDDECHFQHILISKEYQGRGFANLLMEHSFEWYRENGVRKIHLYTEVTNEVAQSLYRKFGFAIDSRAWHFVVPFSTLKPQKKYTCQEILEEEIGSLDGKFDRFPAGEIRCWQTNDEKQTLTLKDDGGVIVGACLFTPGFPGCRPFEIKRLDCFDDFITGIMVRSLPENDFVRIVFAGNDPLAELCKQREYELVHEMYYFTQELII